MAQVLVPGVAQAVMSGMNGSQPWACVTHWKFDNSTAPWTQTDIQLLADTLSTAWQNNAISHCVTTVTMNNVNTVDIGTAAPAVGVNGTIRTGDGGSTWAPASTATLINFGIAARYRGGRPRIYLPWGLGTDRLNEYEWTPTYVAAAATSFTAIVQAVRSAIPPVGGGQVSNVCPAYTYTYVDDPTHHKYQKLRTGLKNVYTVQTYNTRPTFGTQRRRLTQG